MNDNVFGIDYNGEVVWRIEERKVYPGGIEDCPFEGISINEEGEFCLFTWCGWRMVINPRTGDILETILTK